MLALPEMMGATGIPVDQLQRAAPIVSGFLLGYVAMLPLIGRIADLRGRVPVLVAALVVFAFGSLVTALAYDLPSMVAGRFLQGVGGGGLVPATLALVADLYPVQRRGVPLGIVSAVQELGSVVGPLFGALVLSVADWRTIFLINLAVGLVLAAALRAGGTETPSGRHARPLRLGQSPAPAHRPGVRGPRLRPAHRAGHRPDLGRLLHPVRRGRALADAGGRRRDRGVPPVPGALGHGQPADDGPGRVGAELARGRPAGRALPGRRPRRGDPGVRHRGPAGAGVLRPGPLVPPRRGRSGLSPSRCTCVAPRHRWCRAGRCARCPPGVPSSSRFFVGAALIAALIDIPIYARTTTYRTSQLMAALVLVRFLVALPVGAIVGGYLTRTRSAGLVTAVGMAMSATGFFLMSRWGVDSLEDPTSNIALVVCGFGFGLALAPVNAAVLAHTDPGVHGLSSAMVVVARMVGMLVGISALTTIGLRRYYAEQDALPTVTEVCGEPKICTDFRRPPEARRRRPGADRLPGRGLLRPGGRDHRAVRVPRGRDARRSMPTGQSAHSADTTLHYRPARG